MELAGLGLRGNWLLMCRKCVYSRCPAFCCRMSILQCRCVLYCAIWLWYVFVLWKVLMWVTVVCVCSVERSYGLAAKCWSARVSWVNNNYNNNNHDNVYGVLRKLAATIHIHHRHCYYYSAHTRLTDFTIPRRVEFDLGTAVKVHSLCPRLYIAVAVMILTTARGVIQTWVLSHRSRTR